MEFILRGPEGWDLRRRSADPAKGSDTLIRNRVIAAERDPGGVLFFVGDARTIRREDGDDAPVMVNGLDPLDRHNWRLTDEAVYWVLRSGGRAFLMVHILAGGMDRFVTDLPGFAGTGLAVSPDGNEILYPRSGAAQGDLMLIPAGSGLSFPSSGSL